MLKAQNHLRMKREIAGIWGGGRTGEGVEGSMLEERKQIS